MNNILTVALPVFGLIGLGWIVSRLGLLSDKASDGVAEFVATLAIPALLFRTMSQADIPASPPWAYWSAYFLGVGTVWGLAMILARRVFAASRAEAVICGFAAAQANTVMLGIPLVVMVFGEPGVLPMFLLIAVHMPVIMFVAAIQLARAGAGGGHVVAGTARALATNPIILALVLGAVVRVAGVPLPAMLTQVVGQLASAAPPVTLVALGMALARYGLRGNLGPTAVVALLKIVVHPFIVWLLAFHVFDVPPIHAAVAVTLAALPTGVNAYLLAVRYRSGEALASNVISLTTFGSVVSITFWLWFIGAAAP